MSGLKFGRGSGTTATSTTATTTTPDSPPGRVFHVAVVGISGSNDPPPQQQQDQRSHSHRSEHQQQHDLYRSHELVSSASEAGSGKSCLCNRFVRPAEDDYQPQEHVSVLSAADYSTSPINNDHFLYWGEARRTSDDGHECTFSLIEQTEFIDDSNFQPFRSGRGDKDYTKRATNVRVQSPGKIQYYGRCQLGIESEFPNHPMPDGRFNVDGFICTFDLSSSSRRPLQRQVEAVFQLLCQIVRQKKPVVLAATKADDGSAAYLAEANKLLHRKELKGSVQLVETSSLLNVNVDAAFMLLAQLIERASGVGGSSLSSGAHHSHHQLMRYRLSPYTDAASQRKERMETAAKAFEALIRTQVKERKMTWQEASRKFQNDQDFKFYCELWGTDSAKRLFSTYMRQLRDREAKSRLSIYLSRLDRIFRDLLTDVSLVNNGWSACLDYIQSLSVFDSYFADLPSGVAVSLSDAANFLDDDAFYDSGDTRVPSRILLTADAERCFTAYADALKREAKQHRLRKQFADLLNSTPYALPGRSFRDVCVFLATEPACTDELLELNAVDKQEIYEVHQRKITEETRDAFLELLWENVSLFQQRQMENKPAKKRRKEFESKGKIEEDSLGEIEQVLRSDRRYRAMDLLAQRDVMLRKMWMYFQSPFPEPCATRGGCLDVIVKNLISRNIKTPDNLPAFSQCCALDAHSSSQLRIVLLGQNDLAENFHKTIRAACGDDELHLDGNLFSIDFRTISGDLGLAQNAFQSPTYPPHGSFCVYDSQETFQYIRTGMEESLLGDLIHDEPLSQNFYENSHSTASGITPCTGLPTVLVFTPRADFKESEVQRLRESGQDLAGKLQCAFLELARVVLTSSGESAVGGGGASSTGTTRHKEEVVLSYLKMLVRDIQTHSLIARSIREGLSLGELFDCDMRLRVCMMCGDLRGGFVQHVLGPLLSHPIAYRSAKNPQGFVIETYLTEDTKSRVEVDCRSYHDALRMLNPFSVNSDDSSTRRVDGYVFAFAVRRKASVMNMRCLMDVLMGQQHGPLRPGCMVLAVMEEAATDSRDDGPSTEEAELLQSLEQLCLERRVLFLVTALPSAGMSISTFTPLLRQSWDCKISSYDRASTATLNSTVPSLSDEEAVLISKSRSLERDRERDQRKPAMLPRRQKALLSLGSSAYDNFQQSHSNSLDSPTFGTFGVGGARPRARTETNCSSEDLINGPMSRVGLAESTSAASSSTQQLLLLRGTRSTEDILNTSPSSSSSVYPVNGHSHADGLAWQARSAEEAGQERSASQRLVGKLTSGSSRYASFIDQLNSSMARGTQPSPTAPLAMPELIEERENDTHSASGLGDAWSNGTAPSLKSPSSHDRQSLLKQKKPKVPDRYGFRRVVAPCLPPTVPAHHLSLSQEENDPAFPMRASLPEFVDKASPSAKLQHVMSPLDDNVFFASTLDEELKNGPAKPSKYSSKPKREKENKSSVKKSKDKKKKAEPTFEHFAQSADNPIPLFIEKCIKFIESRGIDTEGIYRVSGSRMHADELLRKFLSHPSSVDLYAMDIPIYNVTTALKTFMTDHTPPVIPQSVVDELHDLSFVADKAERIQMIKAALAHLSATHFQLLKYMFAHLRRISDNSKKNKMDSNNLTVCLWPTLCPIELPNDMARFEGIRVEVSEIISALIVDYDRIFQPNHSPSSTLLTTTTPHHHQHPASAVIGSPPSHLGAIAQEAAEAVRQRTVTRHSSAGNSASSLPASPPSSSGETSSNATSSSSLNVKAGGGSLVGSLKSVQV